MRAIIRGHPRERMTERGVTEADVLWVIENFSFSTPGKKGDATLLYGAPRNDGRVLKVVLIGSPPRTEPYIVKTVAWRDEEDD